MSRTRHAALSVLGSSAVAAGRKAISLTLIVALTSGSAVSLGAQTPPLPQAAPAVAQAIETLTLVSGRSMVLPTAFDVVRIAVTDPAIADAVVVVPREILIDGKAPGTVSLIVWGKAERAAVRRSGRALGRLAPAADAHALPRRRASPSASPTKRSCCRGRPRSQDMVVRAGGDRPGRVVEVEGDQPPSRPRKTAPNNQQVMLQVRFAEVDQTALARARRFVLRTRQNVAARTTTQQFPAPEHDDGAPGVHRLSQSFLPVGGSGSASSSGRCSSAAISRASPSRT